MAKMPTAPARPAQGRDAPIAMDGEEFRRLGHQLVDEIAALLDGLPARPVTRGESPQQVRKLLGADRMPERGVPASELLPEATRLLIDHSLFNGHPRFWGYITASPAPIGILADLLASAINPNVGAAILSPVASEIEAQSLRWIADLIGYPRTGGVLVSGGNVANLVGFFAARQAKVGPSLRTDGLYGDDAKLVAYVSTEVHTWIDKAAELSGLGNKQVRRIPVDADLRMDVAALETQIRVDLAEGHRPFVVVGNAGTVGTGAVDPLPAIAQVAKKYDLWFHVDGAYGGPAAMLPDAPADLKGLRAADSIALDPHKWLYAPLEAGCVLVKDPQVLIDTFSHRPAYYRFEGTADDPPINYHEFGLQNSRGFRALKVWLALRQVGREGYVRMLGDDIALAVALAERVEAHEELELATRQLSIATFRYVPRGLAKGGRPTAAYLDKLNEAILGRLQKEGEAFVSNALVHGRFMLRACIVNFRTTLADVEALAGIVVRVGRELDAELRIGGVRPSEAE
jgi:aromatic-L-amino-acid decarboxylase